VCITLEAATVLHVLADPAGVSAHERRSTSRSYFVPTASAEKLLDLAHLTEPARDGRSALIAAADKAAAL